MEKKQYEIDMPKTSQEFKEKLSLANNEKSIDDVEFRFNDNLDFDIPMPKTSQEFKEMVKLWQIKHKKI